MLVGQEHRLTFNSSYFIKRRICDLLFQFIEFTMGVLFQRSVND